MTDITNSMIITDSSLIKINKELINKRTYKEGSIAVEGNVAIINSEASNFSSTSYLYQKDISLKNNLKSLKIEWKGEYSYTSNTENCMWCLHSTTPTIIKDFSLSINNGSVILYYGDTALISISNINWFTTATNHITNYVVFNVNNNKTISYTLHVNINDTIYEETVTTNTDIVFEALTLLTVGIKNAGEENYWRGSINLPSFAIHENNKIIFTPSYKNVFKFTHILIGDGTPSLTDSSTEIDKHIYECPINNEVRRTFNNILLTATIPATDYIHLREIGLYFEDEEGQHLFSKIDNLDINKTEGVEYNLVIQVRLDINVVNTLGMPEIKVNAPKNPSLASFKTIKQIFNYILINLERMIRLNALGIGSYTGGAQSTTAIPSLSDTKPVGIGYNKAQVMYRFLKEISNFQDNANATNNYSQLISEFEERNKAFFDENKIIKTGSVKVFEDGTVNNFSQSSYVQAKEQYYIPSNSSWEFSTSFTTGNNTLTKQSVANFHSTMTTEPLVLGVNYNRLFLSIHEPDAFVLQSALSGNHKYCKNYTRANINNSSLYSWTTPDLNVGVNSHVDITGSGITNNNGIISGFSSSNSVETNKTFSSLSSSWQLSLTFTTGNSLSGTLIADSLSMAIHVYFVDNSLSVFLARGGGETADIIVREAVYFNNVYIDTNSTYTLYLSGENGIYTIAIQDQYQNYEEQILAESSIKKIVISNCPLIMGSTGGSSVFNGSIDLNKSSLYIEGELVWSGTSSLSTVFTENSSYPSPQVPVLYDNQGEIITSLTFIEQTAKIITGDLLANVEENTKYWVKVKHAGNNYAVYFSKNGLDYNKLISVPSDSFIPEFVDAYFGMQKVENNSVQRPFLGNVYLKDTSLSVTYDNQTTTYNFLVNQKDNIKLLDYFHIPQYAYSHEYLKVNNLNDDSSYLSILEGALSSFGDHVDFSTPKGFTLVIKTFINSSTSKLIIAKQNIESNNRYFSLNYLRENIDNGTLDFNIQLLENSVDPETGEASQVLKDFHIQKEIPLKTLKEYTDYPIILTITYDGKEYSPTFKIYKNAELIVTEILPNSYASPSLKGMYLTNRTTLSYEKTLLDQSLYDILCFEGELSQEDVFYVTNMLCTNF